MLSNITSSGRRLLVINPNTNPEVTRRIERNVLADLPEGVVADVVNPQTGPFSIETPADRESAVPAVIDLIKRHPDRDGYILACFDDIAVKEARIIVDVPVFSIARAAIEEATARGERYTIITTVDDQIPAIENLVTKYGSGRVSVRACQVGVAPAASQTERAERLLDAQINLAIRDDLARSIILGSGAYAGRSKALSEKYGITFIEALTTAVRRLAPVPT